MNTTSINQAYEKMEFEIFNVHNDLSYVSTCCAHNSVTSSEALMNLLKNLNFSIYFFFSTATWNSLQGKTWFSQNLTKYLYL